MSLAQIRMETTRGVILGLLMDGNWESDSILYRAVNSVKSADAARDDVRDAIRWLAGKSLIEMTEDDAQPNRQPCLRARITDRGRDFEMGRLYVEGVHRPSGS